MEGSGSLVGCRGNLGEEGQRGGELGRKEGDSRRKPENRRRAKLGTRRKLERGQGRDKKEAGEGVSSVSA